ncbi:hypothetical protein [Planomonospora venezuelensis]|uniref:DUF5666 domain-containing protein n=1 Tax=Planomonospora venezuelensis TaxID=1999 RepID=A0A841DB08_PLAVE|nr:hypothetical protein [Planomonospora venezuelensis]MBB5965305.1 hypothetical protein [Planomonospora venezuelensis]GIN00439.1 hypothetical protein Pve01_20970 [Planomonospora venezuelensis]
MVEKKNDAELLETSPFAGDLDRELAVRPGRSFSALTVALAAGVTLVAGVVAGIQLEKAVGGASGNAAAPQGPGGQGVPQGYGGSGGFRGGQSGQQGGQQSGQQGGQNGRQGGPGGMTVGTVQKVEGDKVYVQAADGSVVTVTTTGETAVRISREGKVADLGAGKTVVVQGARGEDGSVTATSISEGAARGR